MWKSVNVGICNCDSSHSLILFVLAELENYFNFPSKRFNFLQKCFKNASIFFKNFMFLQFLKNQLIYFQRFIL